MNLTNSNLLNKHSCAILSGIFETQTFQVCHTDRINTHTTTKEENQK